MKLKVFKRSVATLFIGATLAVTTVAAAQSGDSLSEMTKRVDEVSDLVKQIAKSSQQQREAIHGAHDSSVAGKCVSVRPLDEHAT